ncbi:hypothetical protein [Leifsonia sp. Leaf264]|uniref:hypothetical protein n=1 Tax=Leifsonia sp. Leaf264 TaxID=1736314 RepID=UPI0006FFEE3C|nr:hypothetical protein [Leifsonia sp. Leaf264]KQO98901.1 hypothetical protein ASF30_12630 [Leifsonia sp. Leaf264]
MNVFRHSLKARKEQFAARKSELGLRKAVFSQQGAIDLASIMVGVIVIAIVGGIIAATVFAVIPWAQKEAGKQALGSVKEAESVAFAQYVANTGEGKYLAFSDLVSGVDADGIDSLIQASESVDVAVSADGSEYIAVSKVSDTLRFYISSDNPNTPVEALPAVKDAKGDPVVITIPSVATAPDSAFN